MAVRVSTYGKGRAKLIECLREFEPFTTSGAMRGTDNPYYSEGMLDSETRQKFNSSRSQIKYVVYSYATPIAWVMEDGEIVIPDFRYSATTSRHQQLCRVYLGKAE